MPRTTPPLPPRLLRTLAGLGTNLQFARLRRLYTAELVAERAGVSRKTLSRAEQGDPAVALGIYARILLALHLDGDLEAVARDDEMGRKLQDLALTTPKRAPRRRHPTDDGAA
ncbi:MAG: helix-turn-helix domain-containing protein [Myxococcota bacterium]|jgi:transcriptional regulator with XRE-family HTH domain